LRSYGITNAAPYASVPAVGLAGDTYFNTSVKQLYISDGTSWIPDQTPGLVVGCRIRRNTDQSISAGATSTIVHTTVVEEQLLAGTSTSYFNTGNANFIVPTGHGGRYWIGAHMRWAGSPQTANPILTIYINGIPIVRDAPGTNPAPGFFEQHCSTIWNLNAGDSISMTATNGGGSAVSVSAVTAGGTDPTGPILEVWRISGITGPPGPQGPDIAAAQSSYFSGQCSGPTSISNNVNTNLQWNQTLNNNFTFTNGTTDIIINQTGRYFIDVIIGGQSAGVPGVYQCYINQIASDGTTNKAIATSMAGPSSGYQAIIGMAMFNCIAGDRIRVTFNCNGQTYTLNTTNTSIVVTPVGGVKGDQGIQGPSGGPVPTGGTPGQILVKTGSADFAVGWQSIHAMKVHHTGTVTVNNATETNIPMSTVDYVRGGMTLSGGFIVVPVTGIYHISGQIGSGNLASNATGTGNVMALLLTGSTYLARSVAYVVNAWPAMIITGTFLLNANDQIKLNFYQAQNATMYMDPASGWAMPCSMEAFLVTT